MPPIHFSEAITTIQEKIASWITSTLSMFPNVVVAIVVVILFALISRFLRRMINRILKRFSYQTALNRLIVNLINLGVLSIGILLALSTLNMEGVVKTALAGAGIIGIALGFAFQEITANFFSGIILAVRQPFTVGSWLETNGHYGVVTYIDLWTTVIRNPTGQLVSIPNKDVLQNIQINYSQKERRVDLEVGISYGDSLPKVKEISVEAIEGVPQRLPKREVELHYTAFGDSSINFVVQYWISFKNEQDYLKAVSEGIMRLKAAYDQEGITIPFPIRTLDFGIKGGEKLAEVLKGSGHSPVGKS